MSEILRISGIKERDRVDIEAIQENEGLEAELQTMNKKQSNIKSTSDDLKKQYKEIYGEVQGVKYQISQATEDCDKHGPNELPGSVACRVGKNGEKGCIIEGRSCLVSRRLTAVEQKKTDIEDAKREILRV